MDIMVLMANCWVQQSWDPYNVPRNVPIRHSAHFNWYLGIEELTRKCRTMAVGQSTLLNYACLLWTFQFLYKYQTNQVVNTFQWFSKQFKVLFLFLLNQGWDLASLMCQKHIVIDCQISSSISNLRVILCNELSQENFSI